MPDPILFYSQFVSPDSLVFDVGANVGNKTSVFLSLGARVVAVEPHPKFVSIFQARFKDVVVLPKAVGPNIGQAWMQFGSELNLTSLSPKWIESVQQSGRFSWHDWNQRMEVELTTLDNLVCEYGTPDFVKIDVEGYESEVLGGLSRPLKVLSFEYTPEHISDTESCVRRLEALGSVEFNYSPRESMKMGLEQWGNGTRLIQTLDSFAGDLTMYGDVYARFL